MFKLPKSKPNGFFAMRHFVFGIAICIAAWTVQAEENTYAPPSDIVLLNNLIHSMQQIKIILKLDETQPIVAPKLTASLDTLQIVYAGLKAETDSTDRFHWHTVSRLDPNALAKPMVFKDWNSPSMQEALNICKGIGNFALNRTKLYAEMKDSAATHKLLQPLADLQYLQLENAKQKNMEKLERYRVKYGPGSARLNLLEAGLNFLVLPYIPGFGANENGPGHWELITAYNTGYLAAFATGSSDFTSTPTLVSTLEFGLRYYIYAQGWGEESVWQRMLKPAYCTAGLAIASREDGFLKWHFTNNARLGIFASYGDFKFALVGMNDWDNSRLLLSRQFQFVPYLF